MRISYVTVLLTAALAVASAQTKAKSDSAADWPMFNRDLAGTRFSPLKQINARNVGKLKEAWSYPLHEEGAGGFGSEVTPIVVGGVMYMPVANRIVALEPETGKELWRYQLPTGFPSRRGVTYWP